MLAATRWFPGEPYTLSLVSAMTALVMVRWGAWAAIPTVLGALAFCIVSGASVVQVAIYGVGNLLALAALPWLKKATWKRLRDNVLLAMAYALCVSLLMQTGRAAVSLVMGYPVDAAVMFYTTDVLSTLFAVLIVWIARRLDGMLEDQAHYVRRIQEEIKNQRTDDSYGSGGWIG